MTTNHLKKKLFNPCEKAAGSRAASNSNHTTTTGIVSQPLPTVNCRLFLTEKPKFRQAEPYRNSTYFESEMFQNLKQIMGGARLLYVQRVESFHEGNWPKSQPGDKCTTHELAMAGLEFVRDGEANCVICHRIVTNLDRSSDPWKAHSEENPKCPLIELGKPDRPDGYTLEQLFQLIGERQALSVDHNLQLFEEKVKRKLIRLTSDELKTAK